MGLAQSRCVALMCGVSLGILASQGALAQQNVNATNITLLERLVIGFGQPKVAIDTPQAVTVVDQDDIDAQQATTVGQVLKQAPGVSVVGSSRITGEAYNIRGIGAAENSGDEARISLNVDGVKKFYEQYRMGSFFSDTELYKRVEVLRGPASSTLYGAGAMGGVINFTTKDASDFIADGNSGAFRVKGSLDTNGTGTVTSATWAHRVNENLEVLAQGNFRRSDLVTLASGETLSSSDFAAWSGLIKGTMTLDDDQTVRLSYQNWNSDAKNQDYGMSGTASYLGKADRKVSDQTLLVSYENEASDNDMLDLKVQLSYADTAVSQRNTSAAVASFGPADYGYGTWQLSAQNTSEFRGDGWENYLTYGFQASRQDRRAKTVSGAGIATHPEGDSANIGVFAQSEHTINDTFTIIAGVRGDVSHMKPKNYASNDAANTQFAFSPKIAAIYELNDNINIFGSVAHTERLPTLDEMYQYSGTTRPQNLDLKKESSNNIELGFGLTGDNLFLDNDRGSLKVTGFVNDVTDGIRASGQSGRPYYENLAGFRIWGLEVEGSYDAEYVFASLGYTFARGEYTKDVLGSTTGTTPTQRYAGDAFDGLAQDRVNLTLGGRLPEHNLEFGTRITVAADPLVAATKTTTTPLPSGWASVDVFTSWKPDYGVFEGTQFQLGVDNIFNADYIENLSSDRSKGRTFKLSLSKQFDY